MRKKVSQRTKRQQESTQETSETLKSSLPLPPPHLQSRESKRDKRESKSNLFKNKLENDNGNKISKSSLRRQKRKTRSNLHGGQLGDMLSTLPEVAEELKNSSQTPFVAKKITPIDPKKSSRKNEKVVRNEIDRFNKVFTNQSYRSNPFESLKSFISSNIEKKQEFIDMDKKREKQKQHEMSDL